MITGRTARALAQLTVNHCTSADPSSLSPYAYSESPACTRQTAIAWFSLYWHLLRCPASWTFCIFLHTVYARNSGPQASVWFWERKQPELDRVLQAWTLCCFTKWHDISNAIFLYSALDSEHCWLFWHLPCTGDAFLSKVSSLKVACLIYLKRLQRNFLHTATIKYKKRNSSHLFSPSEKTDGGLVWMDFLFLSSLHRTSTDFF